jgi:hypothetical protein
MMLKKILGLYFILFTASCLRATGFYIVEQVVMRVKTGALNLNGAYICCLSLRSFTTACYYWFFTVFDHLIICCDNYTYCDKQSKMMISLLTGDMFK